MGMDDNLNFYIMHKNHVVAITNFSAEGAMLSYKTNPSESEHLPLQERQDEFTGLKKWWRERSVPIDQGHISEFLRKHGYHGPEQYLVKNLGLSLTDCYWIRPMDSDLKWEHVNLFTNDFHENVLAEAEGTDDGGIPRYSPNGSLQGSIEKTWSIVDGNRCLVKGNHSILSQESLNEIFSCRIHEGQGFRNHVHYDLIRIKDKPYEFGCISRAFTSERDELIPAWAVYTSEKKPNHLTPYEHFIETAGKLGADKIDLRQFLEYQIMTDYLMSGYDRHMNNIGLIRDPDSLKIKGIAPIYDSGASLFAERAIPKKIGELRHIKTNGFCDSEEKLVKLVTDPSVIDLSRLPTGSDLRQLYEKDPRMNDNDRDTICNYYDKKIEMCRDIQVGRDTNRKAIYIQEF